MQRVPEPELMDGREQARAYAEADFAEPNALFLELLRERFADAVDWRRAVDLGCGPADNTLGFARAHPDCRVDGVDGAGAMLALGQAALAREPALAARVVLIQAFLPSDSLAESSYDVILSNSLLHHLHEPRVLWDSVVALARPGAAVLVMDLMRPATPEAADRLVRSYAADAPDILRRDFRNSLHAAFEPAEVETQLAAVGLDQLTVTVVSDRHLAVSGRIQS